jgi:hypothetical protein
MSRVTVQAHSQWIGRINYIMLLPLAYVSHEIINRFSIFYDFLSFRPFRTSVNSIPWVFDSNHMHPQIPLNECEEPIRPAKVFRISMKIQEHF